MRTNQTIKHIQMLIVICVSIFFSTACGNISTNSGNNSSTNNDATSMFPSSLAVTSPLALEATSALSPSSALKYSTTTAFVPEYKSITEEINNILTGTTTAACTFNPEDFLVLDTDAECYGPEVAYEDHIDATSSINEDGTLPTGDVGIWLETDPVSNSACAASQLDARMSGMQAKTTAALSGLATMICAANANGIALPDASTPGSVTLLTEMNSLGIVDTNFNVATITYVISTGAYTYELDFDYMPSGATVNSVYVDMEHRPTSDPAVYSGDLSILVNDTYAGAYGTNCPSPDVTHNASVQYNVLSSTEVEMEARSGDFCNHNADGRDGNGIVDPSLKFSAATPDGWGNNFNIFTANFDPTDLDGNYAFSWQAGHFDGNTRVINLAVEDAGTTGIAFYGYGDDAELTDGSITGFICNWAGPNSDHTIIEHAQYQEMSVDTTTGLVNSDLAYITYAPTVSCEYDGTDTFVFDTNANGDLTDEDPALDITIASGTMDLLEGLDLNADGNATIEEVIDDAGFILPGI